MRTARSASRRWITARVIVSLALTGSLASIPRTHVYAGETAVPVAHGEFSRPQVLDAHVAAYLVRIRGGANCTGTPIAGGTLVVTAAHCVLESDGDVAASRLVVRDGVVYEPRGVLVDPAYHHAPTARLDAAVLIMGSAIPGAVATLADRLPDTGAVTVAGYQALDSDGSLLRGTSVDDQPLPKAASGPLIKIGTEVAGCVGTVAALEISDAAVKARCGLIPGSSGGALLVRSGDQLVLAGVISTVAYDLSFNGLVPLASIHELLRSPNVYIHPMGEPSATSGPSLARW